MHVEKAIDWAREKGVDIISMSFSIPETSDALKWSISRAASEGIVMMCSSNDDGLNEAWPADATETCTIAACDEYGNLPRNPGANYTFKLQGLNVAAGVVPFLESNDRISGSSVATAIASGLSSLILSCTRLANPTKTYQKVQRSLVTSRLKAMQSIPQSKHLLLEKFGDIDTKVREGLPIDAKGILEKGFVEP